MFSQNLSPNPLEPISDSENVGPQVWSGTLAKFSSRIYDKNRYSELHVRALKKVPYQTQEVDWSNFRVGNCWAVLNVLSLRCQHPWNE